MNGSTWLKDVNSTGPGAKTDMLSLMYLLTVLKSFRSKACMNSITISFALFADSFFCMIFLLWHWIYYLVKFDFRFRETYIQAGGERITGLERLSTACSAIW